MGLSSSLWGSIGGLSLSSPKSLFIQITTDTFHDSFRLIKEIVSLIDAQDGDAPAEDDVVTYPLRHIAALDDKPDSPGGANSAPGSDEFCPTRHISSLFSNNSLELLSQTCVIFPHL